MDRKLVFVSPDFSASFLQAMFRDSVDIGEDDTNTTPTVQEEVLPH